MVITFEELRKIKDQLPDGAIHQIAEELNLTEEHFEKGYHGGFVEIEDSKILEAARRILDQVTAH